MDEYRHHVSGFFAQREQAERALSELVERGIPRERLQLFDADACDDTDACDTGSPSRAPGAKADSNEVLKDVIVDGAIGTAVGTGVGALAQLALVAGNVSLFVASPLVGPLAMLGWGAGLGGFLGAAVGAQRKGRPFSELVRDAITNGQFVLVAETRTEQETASARKVIEAAVGGSHDVVSKVRT